MRTMFPRVTLAVACIAAGCGGSTPHAKLEEVPIDQGGTSTSSGLPPDELSDASVARSVVPAYDGSAPPGVGPQSLDQQAQQPSSDAGTSSAATFQKRPNGLSEKQCNDVVLHFAKLVAKEHKNTAPVAADIPTHPIYGQMYVDCGQTTTKKQQKCAMAARTSASWKKCME